MITSDGTEKDTAPIAISRRDLNSLFSDRGDQSEVQADQGLGQPQSHPKRDLGVNVRPNLIQGEIVGAGQNLDNCKILRNYMF